ncbi:vitamin B12 ABC transporter permease BtuC [Halocatena halophila]|uniref:vitamin B12 ABC transporter permease BtuC n=1 Tax=Halocatena halophila TaxID=2814576 RepID=UPI002ED1450C
MGRWKRTGWWILWLLLAFVATVVWSVTVGPVSIDPLTVCKILLNAIGIPTSIGVHSTSVGGTALSVPGIDLGFVHPFSFAVSQSDRVIVTRIRLPRIALAATVGFGLATAGTVMQGLFRNPMADPSIIGVSSGAAVGAVAMLVLPIALPFGVPLIAFLGAIVTAFGVYLLASSDGRTPVATLLLAGVAVQTFLGAVVSYLLLHAGESVETVLHWLMGDLAAATWSDVVVAAIGSGTAFCVLVGYSRDLNVLLLGEEQAITLGIDVERTKQVLLGLASLATAAAVAVAGVIGFVGLIVPHMLRLVVGPDHRILLPTSALSGAIFLVATDTLARSGPAQLPVGIVTAALGAPFFLYLLRNREVHQL